MNILLLGIYSICCAVLGAAFTVSAGVSFAAIFEIHREQLAKRRVEWKAYLRLFSIILVGGLGALTAKGVFLVYRCLGGPLDVLGLVAPIAVGVGVLLASRVSDDLIRRQAPFLYDGSNWLRRGGTRFRRTRDRH